MTHASISRAIAAALLVALPAVAHAQRVDTVVVRQAVPERSAVAAGVFEYLIPTVGHAYAGKWSRGVIPAAVRIMGVVMLLNETGSDGYAEEFSSTATTGLLMALGGTIWGVWSAVDTAKDHNKSQLTRTSLIVTPTERGVGFGARLAF